MNSCYTKKKRQKTSALSLEALEEDLRNPFTLIEKWKKEGERYGILKISTPQSWRPTCQPKTRDAFTSYRQSIHKLKDGPHFEDGNVYSVASYKEYADSNEQQWLKKLAPELVKQNDDQCDRSKYRTDKIEELYWSTVASTSLDEPCTVDYASNLPINGEFHNGSNWSFQSLDRFKENILQLLDRQIPGITTPWLYFGSLFSTFCWHVEDHFLYSMNYLHSGANKIWYSIPSKFAQAFEDHASTVCLTRSEKSNLLHNMTRMLSPYDFPDNIECYMTVQRPGDLIVTFPEAFHGGYNEGWNCAEAVNFGLMDWTPFGINALQRYRNVKNPVFSNDKLLWDLMKPALEKYITEGQSIPTELKNAFLRACRNEMNDRNTVMNELYKVKKVIPRKRLCGEPLQCHTCKYFNYFSFVFCVCNIDKERVFCLKDCLERNKFECGCTPILCTEISDDEMIEMVDKVKKCTETLLVETDNSDLSTTQSADIRAVTE